MMDIEGSVNKNVSFKENLEEEQLPKAPNGKIIDEKTKVLDRLIQHTFASSRATWRRDDAEEVEAERLAALRISIKTPVKLSEHLLVPTAANIHSKQKLMEEKDNDDDIWNATSPKFEVLSRVKTNFENVRSKLLVPTSSLISSKLAIQQDKEKDKEEVDIPRTIKPIDPSSHVLQVTTSMRNAAWKRDADAVSEAPTMRSDTESRPSKKSGPIVESRLFETTSSMKNSVWKSKEYLQAEEELRREEELAAKVNKKKISRPSSHLLSLTQANNNAKYKVQEEIPIPGKKVRSTSPRLLEFTAALEHAKYKPPESSQWTFNEKAVGQVPQRLLTPTAAFELAKYQKPDIDIDPRELGWKKPDPKPSKLLKVEPPDVETESNSPKNPTPKVKETSERVLMLTTAHQYHRLPSPENSTISRAYSASKALSASRAFSSSRSSSSSRPLTSTESFLRHTSSSSARANSRGKFLLSASTKQLLGSVDDSEAQPGLLSLAKVYRGEKSYPEVPASLLRPTASMRFRGLPDNLSDLSEGSFEDEPKLPVEKIKPVNNTEKFLAPTLSSTLHFAPELPKPKAKVKRVKANERFMAPTQAYANRFSEPKPSKSVGFGTSVSDIQDENTPRGKYLMATKVKSLTTSPTYAKSPGRYTRRSHSLSDMQVRENKNMRDDSVGKLKKYVSVKKLIRVFSPNDADIEETKIESVC